MLRLATFRVPHDVQRRGPAQLSSSTCIGSGLLIRLGAQVFNFPYTPPHVYEKSNTTHVLAKQTYTESNSYLVAIKSFSAYSIYGRLGCNGWGLGNIGL